MIYSVEVTNYLGDSLMLELANPWECGLAVTSITGLGPGKANINVTDISTSDGSLYNSARLNKRNIVIKIKLLEAPTIEASRHRMYEFFPIKRKVKLKFNTDEREVITEGYVEKNEPNIFSNNEESQISIICPDPYFYSTKTQTMYIGGVDPKFEFEFENEDPVLPTINMGDIQLDTRRNIFYEGDDEVGMIFTIYATGTVRDLAIYNISTKEHMRIDDKRLTILTGSHFIKGDKIVISTEKNNKFAMLERDGWEYNILNAIEKDSDWFSIHKGYNAFGYTVSEGNEYLKFIVTNKILYEGI